MDPVSKKYKHVLLGWRDLGSRYGARIGELGGGEGGGKTERSVGAYSWGLGTLKAPPPKRGRGRGPEKLSIFAFKSHILHFVSRTGRSVLGCNLGAQIFINIMEQKL